MKTTLKLFQLDKEREIEKGLGEVKEITMKTQNHCSTRRAESETEAARTTTGGALCEDTTRGESFLRERGLLYACVCVCALCVCYMCVCECTMCLCVCVRAVLSLCGRGRISLSAVFVAVAIGIFRAAAALASCCRCCCRPFGTFCNIVLASLFGAWPRRGFGSDSGSRCNALPWREDTQTRRAAKESHRVSLGLGLSLSLSLPENCCVQRGGLKKKQKKHNKQQQQHYCNNNNYNNKNQIIYNKKTKKKHKLKNNNYNNNKNFNQS